MTVLGMHRAELSFPDEVALHVETVDPLAAKMGEDELSVGDGRRRGQTPGHVPCFERHLFANDSLPKNGAVTTIDGDYDELILAVDRSIVVLAGPAAHAGRQFRA